MCTIDSPKFFVLNQKEESICIQRVKIPLVFPPAHKDMAATTVGHQTSGHI